MEQSYPSHRGRYLQALQSFGSKGKAFSGMAKLACLTMLTVAIVAAMALSKGPYWAQAQGGVCKADMSALMLQCGKYVGRDSPKTSPSHGCCSVVKATDVQCVCEHMPLGASKAVDMDKVFYVCKTCGNPIKPGSKCGTAGNQPRPSFFRPLAWMFSKAS
ncbi:hypothetical protein MLD38_008855 [Melastoma candidum]|uniref:Uncharacterized protein n=1 Tax=Melastoma candidum TaxID=119954 RepID=A0ACB9RX00_9MYRT|nr:hypothetical protein MLD38_008855 [Melastoma candidum]